MISPALFSRDSDEWRTPPALFNVLNRRFSFDIDPAATRQNALCTNFFTAEDDGLKQDWCGRRVFLNCPYSHVKHWIDKCIEESRHALIVSLVPARTDTAWFQKAMASADLVHFLPGRLRFRLPDGMPGGSAPFPSALIGWLGFKGLDAKELR